MASTTLETRRVHSCVCQTSASTLQTDLYLNVFVALGFNYCFDVSAHKLFVEINLLVIATIDTGKESPQLCQTSAST